MSRSYYLKGIPRFMKRPFTPRTLINRSSQSASKPCILATPGVPPSLLLRSIPSIRQYAKPTDPKVSKVRWSFFSKFKKHEGQEDTFNTSVALQGLRHHLGLSSYAASAREAHLGRELDHAISRLLVDGDKGTIVGVYMRILWMLVEDSWQAFIFSSLFPSESDSSESYTEDEMDDLCFELIDLLNDQVSFGRWTRGEFSVAYIGVFLWWWDLPPFS